MSALSLKRWISWLSISSPSATLCRSSCLEQASVEHFGKVTGKRPEASYPTLYKARAMPSPLATPGSHDTTKPATPSSHVLVIIGPGAFIATTTLWPSLTYRRMSSVSSRLSCNVWRSDPSLAFCGTTTASTTSASPAWALRPPRPGQDAALAPSRRMPSRTFALGTCWHAMPFQPLPPAMAKGSWAHACEPISATDAALDSGSTPPSFFKTTVDSATMRAASCNLHSDL
mmetsp:Transcript_61196/g.186813  ORF Transcript_61196/g.186813 Transcript_61196/m.186813 type:complete len:230 (+) Transcript_61196:448-1137(+)